MKIINYNKNEIFAYFSNCKIDSTQLDNCKLNYFYIINKNKIIINNLYEFELINLDCNINDHDIFFISNTGNINKIYDIKSSDNTLWITNKCNSNCLMCPSSEYSRKKGDCFSIKQLLNFIDYIPYESKHITITGGEPFVIGEKIFDIFEKLKRLEDTQFLLLTNGRAFSIPKYIHKFIETKPKNLLIGIPLHSSNPQTHDYITQQKNSFIETYSGILNLLKNDCKIELRIVINKINCDELYDLCTFLVNNAKNIYKVSFIAMEMLGNAAKNSKIVWLSYNKAFTKIKESIELLIYNSIDVSLFNFPLCTVDQKFWLICKKSISPNKIHFLEKCSNCKVKKYCGGFFAGTERLIKTEIKEII